MIQELVESIRGIITPVRILLMIILISLLPSQASAVNVVYSDNIKYSNDAQVNTLSGSWTMMKTITLTESISGNVKISYDLKTDGSGGDPYVQVYKNGAPIGTASTLHGTTTFFTFNRNMSLDALSGDTLELWGYVDSGYNNIVQNFRISYDVIDNWVISTSRSGTTQSVTVCAGGSNGYFYLETPGGMPQFGDLITSGSCSLIGFNVNDLYAVGGYGTWKPTIALDSNHATTKAQTSFVLESNGYSVSFDSNPTGAFVMMGSTGLGFAPLTTTILPGTYSFTFSKSGYVSRTVSYAISQNTMIAETLQLAPTPNPTLPPIQPTPIPTQPPMPNNQWIVQAYESGTNWVMYACAGTNDGDFYVMPPNNQVQYRQTIPAGTCKTIIDSYDHMLSVGTDGKWVATIFDVSDYTSSKSYAEFVLLPKTNTNVTVGNWSVAANKVGTQWNITACAGNFTGYFYVMPPNNHVQYPTTISNRTCYTKIVEESVLVTAGTAGIYTATIFDSADYSNSKAYTQFAVQANDLSPIVPPPKCYRMGVEIDCDPAVSPTNPPYTPPGTTPTPPANPGTQPDNPITPAVNSIWDLIAGFLAGLTPGAQTGLAIMLILGGVFGGASMEGKKGSGILAIAGGVIAIFISAMLGLISMLWPAAIVALGIAFAVYMVMMGGKK